MSHRSLSSSESEYNHSLRYGTPKNRELPKTSQVSFSRTLTQRGRLRSFTQNMQNISLAIRPEKTKKWSKNSREKRSSCKNCQQDRIHVKKLVSRWSFIVISLICYLIFGGLMISWFEQDAHVQSCIKTQEQLHNITEGFLKKSSYYLMPKENVPLFFPDMTEFFEQYTREIHPLVEQRIANDCLTLNHTEWTFAQSLFYASTVVTTVGYGHKVPKTSSGKMFTCCYAVFGIGLVGTFVQATGYYVKILISEEFGFWVKLKGARKRRKLTKEKIKIEKRLLKIENQNQKQAKQNQNQNNNRNINRKQQSLGSFRPDNHGSWKSDKSSHRRRKSSCNSEKSTPLTHWPRATL